MTDLLPDYAGFYHVGVIVPDLEAAIAEHERMGVEFEEPTIVSRPAQSPQGSS